MAKAAIASASGDESSFIGRIKGLPQTIKGYYGEVRNEMRKVTYPNRKEVEGTTVVVIICVFFFGVYFWVVDSLVLGPTLDHIFKYFSTH
jgi:preprotein translocase subunit SecE